MRAVARTELPSNRAVTIWVRLALSSLFNTVILQRSSIKGQV